MNSAPADVVQSHAATAHYALTHRRTFLSAEINGIIDYADTLYNDMEGQNLLKVIFAKYRCNDFLCLHKFWTLK
ncbi:hypothetical protein O3G_MSEX015355 [Manduca sexta]|uniref:Uncharacterized protein n=1 Tax=Manduca sexta TaxID=7130 RepID=A0A921ZWY4_MANSE|nr:hypothetical protein O3G_MSEX015355 [Manduca sexta]